MAISGQTYLATSLDSVRYEKTYEELFNWLSFAYITVTRKHHTQVQVVRDYHAKGGNLVAAKTKDGQN
jgi:hypothetical protein